MSERTHKKSSIARELENTFNLFNAEVMHETYSCTLDFGVEMSAATKIQIEKAGFSVTHEEGTIYTLER